MRSLIKDDNAAGIPLMLGIITLFVAGALFTLLFIEIAFPEFLGYIPSSNSKYFILMMMRAIGLFVLFGFIIAMVKAGQKREADY